MLWCSEGGAPKRTVVLLIHNLESLDTARSGLNRPPWSGMHHAGETTLAFLSCDSQSVYLGACCEGTRSHLRRLAYVGSGAHSTRQSWAGVGATDMGKWSRCIRGLSCAGS
jgi:hypothetical protein